MINQAALGAAGVISEVLSTNHRELQTGTSDPLGSVVRGPALDTQPAGVLTKEGIEGLAMTGTLAPVATDQNQALELAVINNQGRPAGPSDTLWYNGDYNGINGLANELMSLVSHAKTYDDFNVNDKNGWDVTHLWSNNQLSYFADDASYEIRQGVVPGSGGTLVASGTLPCTLALHQSGHFLDITVDVALDKPLHLDPGTYFLNVTPIGFGGGRSFVSTTSGANAVGDPAGNNDNSFFDSRQFSFNFARARDVIQVASVDFSMGVGGSVT